MSERADAHIHFFEGGFQGGSFTHRPGVNIDELACYRSLMADHGVKASLVVGYAADAWCATNNEHLAKLRREDPWIHPTAFCHLDKPFDIPRLEKFRGEGFVGISLYVFGEAAQAALQAFDDSVWRWLVEHRWLISVNSKGENWRAWLPILDKHSNLRVIASHLGLPPAAKTPPNNPAELMADVLALAAYPNTQTKLSGFYALSDPGHDYPHTAAWPYVEAACLAFTPRRMLWASDFSPCLDWLSFPQTYSHFAMMPFLSSEDRKAIEGGNLIRLLAEIAK